MKVFFRILSLFIISQIFGYLFVVSSMGLSFSEIKNIENFTPMEIVDKIGLYYYILMSQLTGVLIPAILYILVYRKKNVDLNTGFILPKRNSYFIYAIFLLFLSYPLIQFSADLNSKMFFSNWLSDESEMIGRMTMDILKMNGIGELLRNIILVGFLPAIGEELFFRAGIQKELLAFFKRKDFAIILTAIIFSAFHLEFDGFLPRFFLGLILGYTYYWSSSLWVPVVIHFINNSLLIITAYFTTDNLEELVSNQSVEPIPVYMLMMSAISVFVIRHQMYKMYIEDKFENKESLND